MNTWKKITSLDTFQLLGAGFVFVWAVDFITKAYWYGIGSFEFMYFCSTILLFAGIGFLFKKREVIVAVLAMAFLFQIPWIIDMAVITFTGHTLNGVASYLFSVKKWEYLISMRHLFTIPALLYGFAHLTSNKSEVHRTILSAPITTFATLIISIAIPFFFAPPIRNINFSNMSTVPFFYNNGNTPHPLHFIFAFVTILFALIIVEFFLNRIPPKNPLWKRDILYLACIFTLGGIILSVLGYIRLHGYLM